MPASMDDDSLTDLSSELSSVRSLSPMIDYPSPISSQDYENGLSRSQESTLKRAREEEKLPPPKKRKTVQPKPRTTEHLNLKIPWQSRAIDQQSQLDLLLKVLRKRRKVVVIAGAGISVSAGS